MIIRPINNYTIIKLDPADVEFGETGILTASGVYDKYNIPKRTGTVMAVGRGMVTASGFIVPPQVAVGDRVYVLEAKIQISVTYNGETCLALSDESHILGIITDEDGPIVSSFAKALAA